jgi:hypothetical protein
MKLLLFLLAISVSATAQATSYGMKKDNIGETLADFMANNRAVDPDYPTPREYPRCSGDANVGNDLEIETLDATAKLWGGDRTCSVIHGGDVAGAGGSVQYWFKADRLDSIFGRFNRSSFALVENAVISKYGPPTEEKKRVYQTAGGASIEGSIAVWRRTDSLIELDEVYSEDVDLSTINIYNPVTREAVIAAMQNRAKTEF